PLLPERATRRMRNTTITQSSAPGVAHRGSVVTELATAENITANPFRVVRGLRDSEWSVPLLPERATRRIRNTTITQSSAPGVAHRGSVGTELATAENITATPFVLFAACE